MNKKTFNKHFELEHVNQKKGFSKIKLKVKPNHLNHGGIAHGGVLATLCDIALAEAVDTLLQKDEWCLTAQLSIDFINPALLNEEIYGFGQVLRKGNTLAFVDGGIKTKNGKRIVRASGIWAIRKKKTKN